MIIIKQLTSFGIVGVLATLTHALVFEITFTYLDISTLIANLVGFSIAFIVSYLGQFNFTFKSEASQLRSKHKASIKFFVTAMIGLGLNITWGYLIIDLFNWPHYIFLLFLCGFTPLVLFALNKLWVFKHRNKNPDQG